MTLQWLRPGHYCLRLLPPTALAVLVLVNLSNNGWSQPADLTGAWNGGGWVLFSSGARQRVLCHAHYGSYSERIVGLRATATCATESGSVSQVATLRRVGANDYAGSFYNAKYKVSGRFHVAVHGNRQSVMLISKIGSASLMLKR